MDLKIQLQRSTSTPEKLASRCSPYGRPLKEKIKNAVSAFLEGNLIRPLGLGTLYFGYAEFEVYALLGASQPSRARMRS